MMEVDAEIDELNLASESLRTHKLYNKYQKIYYDLSMQLIDLDEKRKKLKLDLTEYYLGKASDEVYKERPKQTKVIKSDVDLYLKADNEYAELESKILKVELLIKTIDDYMKQLSGRNFAIKNAIDYKKFQGGGY